MRWLTTLFAAGVVATASAAAADAVHVFGPVGSATERRALVVVESDDGGCASWDDVELTSADAGVAVELGEAMGACARWVRVTAAPGRDRVRLVARLPGRELSAEVPMGGTGRLQVVAHRTGPVVRVTVPDLDDRSDVRVVAHWSDGRVALEPRDGGWEGRVPAGVLLGVVARTGTLSGITAVQGTGASAQVLVLPSDLAVEARGAPRTAAFVIATDRRGQLSRNVPLRVQSEQAALEAMSWVSPGVAALVFSVQRDVPSAELRVSLGSGEPVVTALPVVTSFPANALVDAPGALERGRALTAVVSATGVDGRPLADASLRLRCGGASAAVPVHDGMATCSDLPVGEHVVTALAIVDGWSIPLSSAVVRVTAPASPQVAEVDEPDPVEPVVAPRAAARSPGRVAAALHGGADTARRLSFGLRAELQLALGDAVLVTAGARYSLTPLGLEGEGLVVGTLSGARHATEVLVGASVRTGGVVGWIGRASAGASVARVIATLQDADASLTEVALVGDVGGGVELALPSAPRMHATVGARVLGSVSDTTWDDPPVRVYVEVGSALDL